MKRVYFVRHGETASNVNRSWQDPTEILNEKGQEQVTVVAKRIKSLTFDKMIVSTLPRAVQTAEAIVLENNMKYELSDLFREIKPPTSLIGAVHTDDEESLMNKFKIARAEFADDEAWRFEDEENGTDFLNRIKKSLQYLRDLPEENILVVTHGGYLRCCLGLVITAGDCTARDMYKFTTTAKMTNAGITVIEWNDSNWVLNTWNDQAHFAE
ncbi:histidine phosphatase family protein [Patescibacteria group bacterium]|nr:histidine phosphatase family protein [Patescibacteria group bacterium]